MAREQHRAHGRFVAGGDLHGRYAQIASVLRTADPARPNRASTRRFDEARLAAGCPDLPRAKNLAAWLGMSWNDVKLVALEDERDRVRTYTSRRRAAPAPWVDRRGAAVALQRVAQALGRDDLAATDYDAYQKRSASAVRELLPTSAQIVKLFGSWSAAVAEAGLQASRRPRTPGMPAVDAIAIFVRTQGWLPRRKDLERFAADPRWAFPLQRLSTHPWQHWLDEFASRWTEEHRQPPPASVARTSFIPLTKEETQALPRPTQAPRGWWTYDRTLECLIAYLADNPHVANVRQPAYREWAKRRNAAGIRTAAPSTLTRFGTLKSLEITAREELARRGP